MYRIGIWERTKFCGYLLHWEYELLARLLTC